MKKKILSILLFAIFVLSLVPSVAVAETVETNYGSQVSSENVYEKFHFYTEEYQAESIESFSELNTAMTMLRETSASAGARAVGTAEEKPIYVTVEFKSEFSQTSEFQAFSQERFNLKTPEEVLDFRQRLNSFSKAFHRAEAEKNQQLLSDLGYKSIDHIDYSPFFQMEMDVTSVNIDEFVTVASSDDVMHVSFSEAASCFSDSEELNNYVFQGETSWESAMEAINASFYVDSGIYDGTSVRVGVFEANGVCDVSNVNLVGVDITLDPSFLSVSDHATMVVSVIAKMAPGAKYYVSQINEEIDDTPSLEWFIDNYCDVVNCSFGYNRYAGYIFGYDSIYDYQISNHYLTVVKSAGNVSAGNPNAYVTSPGNAFNVITVGGLIRTPLDEENLYFSLTHASGACFEEMDDSGLIKPEISAMYEIEVPGLPANCGTSFAAPQVAGCVALMMDKDSSYRTQPDLVKAVLVATATETADNNADVEHFDERVGAGCLNVWEAVRHTNSAYYSFWDQGPVDEEAYSRTISLTAGKEVQIALSWLVDVSSDYQIREDTDYDLILYSVSNPGNPVAISQQWHYANTEFIRFTVPTTGAYRIVVYRYWEESSGRFLSLAYDF